MFMHSSMLARIATSTVFSNQRIEKRMRSFNHTHVCTYLKLSMSSSKTQDVPCVAPLARASSCCLRILVQRGGNSKTVEQWPPSSELEITLAASPAASAHKKLCQTRMAFASHEGIWLHESKHPLGQPKAV
eukprot:1142325-Pelagomonas_calceolata.AAC.2